MATFIGGLLTLLQKCCYKWRPMMCLALDVANFINFISKMAKVVPQKSLFIHFIFFHFLKNKKNKIKINHQVAK
jgi:hypothetical protein